MLKSRQGPSDTTTVSDLSRLLDDIYGGSADDAADGEVSDDLLADASWLDELTAPVEPPASGDLTATVPVDLPPLPALGDDPEATAEVAAVAPSGWQRSDDDILPAGRSGGRFRRQRQAPVEPGIAPTIEAFAAEAGDEAALDELVTPGAGPLSRLRRKRS